MRGALPAPWLVCAGVGTGARAFDAVRLFAVSAADGEVGGGLAVIAGHQYLGSDERKVVVLPALSYQCQNDGFAGTGNGIGCKFDSPSSLQ
jgi:outer membrane scaffolding protein for murein synthesis (MipA/OmpV family)